MGCLGVFRFCDLGLGATCMSMSSIINKTGFRGKANLCFISLGLKGLKARFHKRGG